MALILSPLLVRVSGTAFAMLTMAFSMLIFVAALKYREVTGGEDGIGITSIPPLNIPGLVSIDMTDKINFYYFAIVVVAICLYLLWFYTKTPFGSLIVGIRDNALRMDYLGFNLPQTKAINLIVSGTFAGIAGAVHGLLMKLVSTVGVLDIGTSFKPLMMAYIGGIGSFFGPIIGSAVLHILEDVVIQIYGTDRPGQRHHLHPGGLICTTGSDRSFQHSQGKMVSKGEGFMKILETKGLYHDFKGLEVLFDVNLQVKEGERLALIGPNGAGKTTLFNVITGKYHADARGRCSLKEKRSPGLEPHQLSRIGMGRSFQITSTFARLTAFQNIRQAVLSKKGIRFQMFRKLDKMQDITQETDEVLKRINLDRAAGYSRRNALLRETSFSGNQHGPGHGPRSDHAGRAHGRHVPG